MKIVFVIPGVSGGGVRSIVRIATGLAKKGHDLRLLYRKPPRNMIDMARNAYQSFRYGRRSQWIQSFPGLVEAYRNLTPEIVGQNDVVIGVGVSCVLEIAELPGTCGQKIHNSRGVEPWIEKQMQRAWKISMPRIVVGSHLVQLMRDMGSNDPIHVAHNGVDQKDYFPCVPEDQRKGIGTVYHGAAVKDPDLILAVLNNIHQHDPNLPIHVFGSYPRPKKLPTAAEYVRYPTLEQARDLYSRSLIWFMCSRCEGFGNPLLEALACGCTIVSTDCGGPADLISSGENGFITPLGNADAMTTHIEKILQDQSLREKFTNNSQQLLQRFTWTQAIEDFESALLKCINLVHTQ